MPGIVICMALAAVTIAAASRSEKDDQRKQQAERVRELESWLATLERERDQLMSHIDNLGRLARAQQASVDGVVEESQLLGQRLGELEAAISAKNAQIRGLVLRLHGAAPPGTTSAPVVSEATRRPARS